MLRSLPLSVSGPRGWCSPLWAMAMLGLLLLPVDYRAGADEAHPHSLFQLWTEAADGSVQHHGRAADAHDDGAGGAPYHGSSGTDGTRPDLGSLQNSSPAMSGLPVLLTMAVLLLEVDALRQPIEWASRRLTGRVPRIPTPPPRWTSAV